MMEEVSIEEDVSIMEGFSLGRGLSLASRSLGLNTLGTATPPGLIIRRSMLCRLVIVLAEHVDRLDATWLVMLQPSSIHF